MNPSAEGYFRKYLLAVLEHGKTTLDQLQNEASRKEMEEVVGNVLFDRPGPRYTNSNLTPQEQFFGKIWRGMNEIYHSHRALLDIEIYIRQAPYRHSQISKTRQLHYHISNYLNEVYILHERLETYAKVVTRAYGRGRKIDNPEKVLELISKLIKPMEGIVSIRGSHVHGSRYSDPDLDRLELFELLSSHDEPDFTKVMYPYVLRETRKKWRTRIQENGRAFEIILDNYFFVLYKFVFTEKGEFIVPFQSRSS